VTIPTSPNPGPPARPHSKRMRAFCVATGVALSLFALFYFAWTPVRVRYSAWRVDRNTPFVRPKRATTPAEERDYLRKGLLAFRADPEAFFRDCPEAKHIIYLMEAGPAARSTWRRFLRSSRLGNTAMLALAAGESTWAMPMLIELAQDDDKETAWHALITADLLVGNDRILGPTVKDQPEESRVACRRRLLEWWQREGKAKYGREAE